MVYQSVRLRPTCIQDLVVSPVKWDTNNGIEEIKLERQIATRSKREDFDLALCAMGLGRGRNSDTTGG